MNPDGRWQWDRKKGQKMLSDDDIYAVAHIATENLAVLKNDDKFDTDGMYVLEKLAASIITLHLREAVLSLQLQAWGVTELPRFEETGLEGSYPFLVVKKHHTEALFEYFRGQEDFDFDFDFENWVANRRLGDVPFREWEEYW